MPDENSESSDFPWLDTRDRHPPASRQRILFRRPGGDDHPSWPDQMNSESKKIADITSAPPDDRIEPSGGLLNDVLEPRPYDARLRELEFPD